MNQRGQIVLAMIEREKKNKTKKKRNSWYATMVGFFRINIVEYAFN